MSFAEAPSDVRLKLVDIMEDLGELIAGRVDRKQMKRLLDLADDPRAKEDDDEPWTRSPSYGLEVVAGALEAARLLEAQWGLVNGKVNCHVDQLRSACEKLRGYGFRYPLTQTDLSWDRASQLYVFNFDGFLVDAVTGQSRIGALASHLRKQGWRSAEVNEARDWAAVSIAMRDAPDATLLVETLNVAHTRRTSILLK